MKYEIDVERAPMHELVEHIEHQAVAERWVGGSWTCEILLRLAREIQRIDAETQDRIKVRSMMRDAS